MKPSVSRIIDTVPKPVLTAGTVLGVILFFCVAVSLAVSYEKLRLPVIVILFVCTCLCMRMLHTDDPPGGTVDWKRMDSRMRRYLGLYLDGFHVVPRQLTVDGHCEASVADRCDTDLEPPGLAMYVSAPDGLGGLCSRVRDFFEQDELCDTDPIILFAGGSQDSLRKAFHAIPYDRRKPGYRVLVSTNQFVPDHYRITVTVISEEDELS